MAPTFDQLVIDHNTSPTDPFVRLPEDYDDTPRGCWYKIDGLRSSAFEPDDHLVVQVFPADHRGQTAAVRVTVSVTPPVSTKVTRYLYAEATVHVGPGTAYPCDPTDRAAVQTLALAILGHAAQTPVFTHRCSGLTPGQSYRVQGDKLNFAQGFSAHEARVMARVIDVSLASFR